MQFDRKLAIHIARATDDRDRARYFAGREREIAAFETALVQASGKQQAVFRIFQGPPGCGKTSLAAHLAEMYGSRVLFVPAEPHHLDTVAALSRRIAATATSRTGATRAARIAASLAAEHFGVESLADLADDASTHLATKAFPVVVHLDEAHETAPKVGETLRSLHTLGAGVPCVVVLTGLAHTKTRVTAIPGLSRLASDAVEPMGHMDTAECADSLTAMLEAVNAQGTPAERKALAAQAAPLAREWPQHLHCVHKALCEELLRVDGRIGSVDRETAREGVSAMRSAYYEARLEYSVFEIDPAMTRRIVGKAHTGSLRGAGLHELCEREITRSGFAAEFHDAGVSRSTFVKALFEKGILSRSAGGEWSVAIPSMGEWARDKLPPRDDDPAANRGGR